MYPTNRDIELSDKWAVNRMIDLEESIKLQTRQLNTLLKDISFKTSYSENSSVRADYLSHIRAEIHKCATQTK